MIKKKNLKRISVKPVVAGKQRDKVNKRKGQGSASKPVKKRARKNVIESPLEYSSTSGSESEDCTYAAPTIINKHNISAPSIPRAPGEISSQYKFRPLPRVLGEQFVANSDEGGAILSQAARPSRSDRVLNRKAKSSNSIYNGVKKSFFDLASIPAKFNGPAPHDFKGKLSTELLPHSVKTANFHSTCRPLDPWMSDQLLIENETPNWIKSSNFSTIAKRKKLQSDVTHREIDFNQFDDSKVQCVDNSALRIVCSVSCCSFFRWGFRTDEQVEEDMKNGITIRPDCPGAKVRLVLQETLMWTLFKVKRKYKPVVRIIPVEGAGFGMEYLGYVKNGAPLDKMKRRRWKARFGPFCAYQGELLTGDSLTEQMQLIGGNNYLATVSNGAAIDSTSPYFGNLAAFINRSCIPNVEFIKWLMDEKPYILMELKPGQSISPGSHVTAHYPLAPGVECVCWIGGKFDKSRCWGIETTRTDLKQVIGEVNAAKSRDEQGERPL